MATLQASILRRLRTGRINTNKKRDKTNPSDANINVKEIAEKSTDPTTKLLGQAISQVKDAKSIVPTISDVWGGDVHTAIINALTESAAENVNIEQKVKATQDILKSLIN